MVRLDRTVALAVALMQKVRSKLDHDEAGQMAVPASRYVVSNGTMPGRACAL